MFDINTKNVKKGRKFYYILLVVVIIITLIFGGIFISNIIKLNSLDSTVLSTRVELKLYVNDEGNTMYSPVYYYKVNGQNYSCGSSWSSNNNPGTQNKTVYYDSKNPSNCITEYSKSKNYITLICLTFLIVIIIFLVTNIRKVNKRIKSILELNQKGKLIKNLPYRLENTGMIINNAPIQRIVIDYTLSSGTQVTLYGDARHDKKHYDTDGMVDLLIDDNNPDNYFIDFEINRLTGNLPQDYYQQSAPNQNNLNNYQQQIFNQSQTQQISQNNMQ